MTFEEIRWNIFQKINLKIFFFLKKNVISHLALQLSNNIL